MNKKIINYSICLIIFSGISIVVFFKFFSKPRESDIDWLDANYNFIVASSLAKISSPISGYTIIGEMPHDVNEACKNLVKKNINYLYYINVRLKTDGTNSILVQTWPNYVIYKSNRTEQPIIGLPIVMKYKGWVVIDNSRD